MASNVTVNSKLSGFVDKYRPSTRLLKVFFETINDSAVQTLLLIKFYIENFCESGALTIKNPLKRRALPLFKLTYGLNNNKNDSAVYKITLSLNGDVVRINW